MTPQDLKNVMSSGLLSFPITDFDANGDFDAKSYAARLEWLAAAPTRIICRRFIGK